MESILFIFNSCLEFFTSLDIFIYYFGAMFVLTSFGFVRKMMNRC